MSKPFVRSDLKEREFGRQLMQQLIAYAKAEGLNEISDAVLDENCASCGCASSSVLPPKKPRVTHASRAWS